MKYQLGFEIKAEINSDDLLDMILEKIKQEEFIKIEVYLDNSPQEKKADSSEELLWQEINRLKSLKSRQPLWLIYINSAELEDYMQKESYWLEAIYEKLGAIARPLTMEELNKSNYEY